MDKFENFVTSINPNAYQEINRTITPANPNEFGNENILPRLRERALELVGVEALDFLDNTGIKLEPYDTRTNAFGKLDSSIVLGFKYLDREVFIHPTQTADKIHGVAIDYWMDDANTNPRFGAMRFRESQDSLGNNTLAFLRFLGDFVEKVDNNLIVNPSDERREKLYTRFLKTHGPKDHNVYIKNKVIIKQRSLIPEPAIF